MGAATLVAITKEQLMPATETRPVRYPKIETQYCFSNKGEGRENGIGPLTCQQVKALLGWETEEDYKKRMETEAAASGDVHKGAKKVTGFGDEFLLKDVTGKKVMCWYNDKNRPFTESHAYEVAQDILNGNWRLNLENVIISRYGTIQSGQHRLIGFVLACQMWAKDEKWRHYWKTEPVIESLIAFGGSEDPDTVRTLDNVRPRALSDIFYTSPVFANLSAAERNECCRSLDYGVDTLWRRTGAGKDDLNKYQTHSASLEFFDRHPRLKMAVKHVFDHNKDRQISGNLKLNTGHSAAMLYLMGCSTSDKAKYSQDPMEKSLKWDNWDRAIEFWNLLADGNMAMDPVKLALGSLVDEDTGSGGRAPEKMVVIAKAWGFFLRKQKFTADDIMPEYGEDDNGNRVLNDSALFGGIDLGHKTKKVEEVPTPEQVKERAEAIKAERLAQMQGTIAAGKAAPSPAPKNPPQKPPTSSQAAPTSLPTPKPAPKAKPASGGNGQPPLAGGTGPAPAKKPPTPKPKQETQSIQQGKDKF
jgi:predicted component of type VI protein secretion system